MFYLLFAPWTKYEGKNDPLISICIQTYEKRSRENKSDSLVKKNQILYFVLVIMSLDFLWAFEKSHQNN